MKLVELMIKLEKRGLLKESLGEFDLEINGLSYDSRKVEKGHLFICKGLSFKSEYLNNAVKRGAVAYLSEKAYKEIRLPALIVTDIRQAMAVVADTYYKSPWQELSLIGITGTKGKSTTTMFLESILNEAYHPKKVGLTSSLRIYDGRIDTPASLTTPESLDLFSYLDHAKKAKLDAMIVEVSSQALKYHRTGELCFAHGIFLNIGEDHISPVEHPDFLDYFNSKLRFFEQCQKAYINLDSDHIEKIMAHANAASEVITFSLEKESDYQAYDLKTDEDKILFKVKSKAFDASFVLNVTGRFNVSNALSAIAVASEMGIELTTIQKGLEKAKLVGRMEVIKATENCPKIIVDYAHNKLSFETVLKSSKEEARGKLWLVFGAPGGKAKNRRTDLGEVASLYANKIILTTDDAYNEDAALIAQEIESGYLNAVDTVFIRERKEAVIYAILNAEAKDTVLLLGKGAEVFQKMAECQVPYEGDYNNALFACAKRGKGL